MEGVVTTNRVNVSKGGLESILDLTVEDVTDNLRSMDISGKASSNGRINALWTGTGIAVDWIHSAEYIRRDCQMEYVWEMVDPEIGQLPGQGPNGQLVEVTCNLPQPAPVDADAIQLGYERVVARANAEFPGADEESVKFKNSMIMHAMNIRNDNDEFKAGTEYRDRIVKDGIERMDKWEKKKKEHDERDGNVDG